MLLFINKRDSAKCVSVHGTLYTPLTTCSIFQQMLNRQCNFVGYSYDTEAHIMHI